MQLPTHETEKELIFAITLEISQDNKDHEFNLILVRLLECFVNFYTSA